MNAKPTTYSNASTISGRNDAELSRRRRAFAFAGVLLAMFLSVMSQTSISTAMPHIVADLGGFDRYTWAATAYLVAAAIAAPITGRLSDLYGRRAFFVLGLAVFIVGAAAAGSSQSMTQLIASRAVQGIGGGILMANCVAAVANLFPRKERGKYQGIVGAAFGLASVAGPILGGYVTDHFDWHWVFLLNVPAGIAALLILLGFPRTASGAADVRLDYLGMAALALTVVPLMLALSWAGAHHAWGSPRVVGSLAFSLAMAGVFVFVESKAPYPIMPLAIYRNRAVVVCVVVTALTAFGLYSIVVLMPLLFQGALGASAGDSGKFLSALMVGVVVGAALSGQLLSRAGGHYRIQAVVSTGLMAVGVYLLSAAIQHANPTEAMAYLAVVGVGMGGALSVANNAVQNSVPLRSVGTGTSTIQFYRIVSGSLGLAVLGAAMTDRYSARLEETVSTDARAALPSGLFDSLKHDPRALGDPTAMENLRGSITQVGPDGGPLVDSLIASMRGALSGAVGDALTIAAILVALSAIAALFLSVRDPTSDSP